MSAWPHPIKAVIFDNDGLLLDSECIYARIHQELTGRHLDWDLRGRLMGRTGIEACTIIVKEYEMNETPTEYLQRRDIRLKSEFAKARLFPGSKRIVSMMASKNIPFALATGSSTASFLIKITDHQDFYSQFKWITTGDEVTLGKPNPEIFLIALKKMNLDIDPENVLVFEDSPLGVRAANNAGMAVVMVPDPTMEPKAHLDVAGAKPTMILKDLNEFRWDMFSWE